MPDAPRRGLTAWRMELRLLGRTWWYPLVLIGWLGLFGYTFWDPYALSAEAALNGEMGGFGTALISLLAVYFGAASASRSGRARFAALEDTLPTGAEVLLGRWAATVVALLPTQAAPLAIAYAVGPVGSFWRAAPVYLGEAVITIAFSGALGWLFVIWLGPRRWVYPLLTGVWLAGLYTAVLLVAGTPWHVPAAALLDFTRSRMPDTYGGGGNYTELWGRLLRGGLPRWLNLFYAGLMALVVALVAGRSQARRLHRLPAATIGGVAVALALALASGGRYVSLVRAWEAAAVPDGGYSAATTVITGPEAIDAWEVTADLRDPARPTFTADLTLRNAGSDPLASARLTLHRDLAIAESSVPARRDGETITLDLPEPLAPGESTNVHLVYGGALRSYLQPYQGMPEPLYFTAADGVLLSLAAGWYPLPGAFPIGADHTESLHPAAAFRLMVRAPDGFGVISNLPPVEPNVFAADRASWVFLIGSPRLRVEQIGTTTVAAPEAVMPGARALAGRYADMLDDLVRFFPGARPAGMTAVVLDWGVAQRSFPFSAPPVGDHVLLTLLAEPNDDAARVGDYPLERLGVASVVVDALWVLAGGDADESGFAFWGVSQFLSAYWLANGDADRIAAWIEEAREQFPSDLSTPVALAVSDVYREQGEDGVTRVIERMLRGEAPTGPHDPQEAADWVKEAAGAR